MSDDLLALYSLILGIGCILAWGFCRTVAAIQANRLRRSADAIKLHVVKGGRLPDGAPSTLARDYFQIRWLGIIGNVLLFCGVSILVLVQFVLP